MGDRSRIKVECETLSENIRRSDRAGSRRIGAFGATTYDSGLALRLARSRRRAVPGIYTTILLFCHIFRQRSSLAGCPSKPLTLLSIFVTRLGGGFARGIRVPVFFLLAPGLLRNSIWYTGWDVKEVLVAFRNGFRFLLCSWILAIRPSLLQRRSAWQGEERQQRAATCALYRQAERHTWWNAQYW
jgi:hypothetical protein